MSDLSVLDQSFALPPAGMPAGLMALATPPLFETPSLDLQIHEVSFRQLRTHEIPSILHLRKEIQFSSAVLADEGFATREKKETRSASSVRSSALGNT